MPWWGVVLLLVGLLAPPAQTQPREPLPLVVQLQLSDASQPLADVTCTVLDAQGQVVTTTTTDTAGRAHFDLVPGGYTLTLAGTTLDGVPLQLNGLYAARGGLPVFVTAEQPDLVLLVDAPTGLVGFGPILDRATGSQEELPPATAVPPVAPAPPTVAFAPTLAAAPRPSLCPTGTTPTLAGRTVVCTPAPAAPATPITSSAPHPLLVTLLGTTLLGVGVLVVVELRRSRRARP